jgi:hypothetical protein
LEERGGNNSILADSIRKDQKTRVIHETKKSAVGKGASGEYTHLNIAATSVAPALGGLALSIEKALSFY